MIVCGLDISTSCIGICLVDTETDENHFFACSPKGNDWIEKASSAKVYLHNLFINHEIKKVYIEENLQAFRPGLSSAKTLMALARFNGVVSFIIQDIFGIKPEFLNVNAARKELGIKINRKSDLSTKEQVFKSVNECTDFQWPTKVLKSGPRKGKEILDSTSYDMADAYVIVRAALSKGDTSH
jgi:hypothetical protein